MEGVESARQRQWVAGARARVCMGVLGQVRDACAGKNSVLFYVETICQNPLRRRRSLCVHYVYNLLLWTAHPVDKSYFQHSGALHRPVCVGAHCSRTRPVVPSGNRAQKTRRKKTPTRLQLIRANIRQFVSHESCFCFVVHSCSYTYKSAMT